MNENEIKQEVTKMKKSKDIVRKYIRDFNKGFRTINTNTVNTKLLENLYVNFIDIAYKPSEVHQFLLGKLVDIETKISETLTNEQKDLFKIQEFILDEMSNDMGLQSFVFGYCLANALNAEAAAYTLDNKFLKQQVQQLKNNTKEN